MNLKKHFAGKKAFTLAEVLITLGIIGVVAAMTLPTLLTNVQKHVLAVATRKFHSNISNAIKLYMTEEGTDDLRYSDLCISEYNNDGEQRAQNAVDDFIREHFKVVKECDITQASNCFAPSYKHFNNSNNNPYQSILFLGYYGKVFVLADGTALSITPGYYVNGGHDGTATIGVNVDVNGQKGPNVIGYDMWSMSIFYDGSVDESGVGPEVRKNGNIKEAREARFSACKEQYGGCFGHFLNNNYKFDY